MKGMKGQPFRNPNEIQFGHVVSGSKTKKKAFDAFAKGEETFEPAEPPLKKKFVFRPRSVQNDESASQSNPYSWRTNTSETQATQQQEEREVRRPVPTSCARPADIDDDNDRSLEEVHTPESDATPQLGEIAASPETWERKIFVGNLDPLCDAERLKVYFNDEVGADVEDTVVMYDKWNNSRGFGYVVFYDSDMVEIVTAQSHEIDGQAVDVGKCLPGGQAT